MIGIATTVFDVSGARVFTGADQAIVADNRKGSRRVVRTATLDGGVAVADLGYSDGDRDMEIKEVSAQADAVEFAKYIVENYNRVVICTPDGAYEAAPDSYSLTGGTLTLKVLVISKLSQ